MSDLISRTKALDMIRTLQTYKLFEGDDMILVDKADVQTELMMLPSAQPERKKGKWIRHPEVKNVYGGIYIECTECGEKYVVQHILDEKFCRNCGADMRGEQHETD